jgi:hypothetical protein
MEPKLLPIKEENEDLLKVEGERIAINATVKEDVDPCINLQGNGVSHLTMLKKNIFSPFPLSPLHTILEAARMQCSLPVDAETPPIKGLGLSSHTNIALLPLNMLLPKKAAKPSDWPSPKQI